MSCDSRGLLVGCVEIEVIAEIVANKIGNVLEYKNNINMFSPSDNSIIKSGCIIFETNGIKRMLHCFFNSSQSDMQCEDNIDKSLIYTQISIGAWGNSEEIIENIVGEFGGYIDRNDCDGIGYEKVECEKSIQLRPIIHVSMDEVNEKFGGIVIIDK